MTNHPTYERLLQAAAELKAISTPTQLAKEMQKSGLNVLTQHLNNWRTRGVPNDKFLDLGQWLGCNPYWLKDGSGEIKTVAYGVSRQQSIVLKAMERMPGESQDQMVKISNTFAEPDDNGKDGSPSKAAKQ